MTAAYKITLNHRPLAMKKMEPYEFIFHDAVNLLFSQKNPRTQSKYVFILLPRKNLNSGEEEGKKEEEKKK